MKRILLLVDSRWRDTFGIALLWWKIKQLAPGYTVVASSFDLWEQAVELVRPNVVVMNHTFGHRNQRIAHRVRLHGGKVAVLPTEGRPNSKDIAAWFESQDRHDKFLSWSDLVAPANSVTTGCPRFEIYGDYRHLIDSKEIARDKLGIRQDAHVILVASSFPQAKFAYTSSTFNDQDWRDLGITSIPGREDPALFAQRQYQEMERFKRLAHELEYDNHTVIIAPHPMEDRLYWQSSGLNIASPEYIFNLLAAANGLIAAEGCLTVQDAWLAGVPALQLVNGEYSDGPAAEALEIGMKAEAFTDAIKWANMPTDSEPEPRTAYLKKHGYSRPNSALDTAYQIVLLADSTESIPNSPENLSKMSQLLMQHSMQVAYPDVNALHIGKSAGANAIHGWIRRIDV